MNRRLILAAAVLLILATMRAWAVPAHVQDLDTGERNASGDTIVITLTVNVTAGNTILLAVNADNFFCTGDCFSVTDSAGNLYITDIQLQLGNMDMALIRASNVMALVATDTITVTQDAKSDAGAVVGVEVSGLDNSPLDKTAFSDGSSTTPDSGLTATTTVADEFLWGGVGHRNDTAVSWTPAAGWTVDGEEDGIKGAVKRSIRGNYQVVSATAQYKINGTLGSSEDWGAMIATYKTAAAPTGDGFMTPFMRMWGSNP